MGRKGHRGFWRDNWGCSDAAGQSRKEEVEREDAEETEADTPQEIYRVSRSAAASSAHIYRGLLLDRSWKRLCDGSMFHKKS